MWLTKESGQKKIIIPISCRNPETFIIYKALSNYSLYRPQRSLRIEHPPNGILLPYKIAEDQTPPSKEQQG
jgi:hypothetical protein